MLGNTKLCTWLWLVAHDISLVVYIRKTGHFIRPFKLDRDGHRYILEIFKHIFTINLTENNLKSDFTYFLHLEKGSNVSSLVLKPEHPFLHQQAVLEEVFTPPP